MAQFNEGISSTKRQCFLPAHEVIKTLRIDETPYEHEEDEFIEIAIVTIKEERSTIWERLRAFISKIRSYIWD